MPGWLSQRAWEALCVPHVTRVRVGIWTLQGTAVGGSIGEFLQLPLLLFVQLTELLSFKS